MVKEILTWILKQDAFQDSRHETDLEPIRKARSWLVSCEPRPRTLLMLAERLDMILSIIL